MECFLVHLYDQEETGLCLLRAKSRETWDCRVQVSRIYHLTKSPLQYLIIVELSRKNPYVSEVIAQEPLRPVRNLLFRFVSFRTTATKEWLFSSKVLIEFVHTFEFRLTVRLGNLVLVEL